MSGNPRGNFRKRRASTLSEELNEDGRLLRMFVSRGLHHEPGACERASRDWLIHKDFYTQWIDEFAGLYGSAKPEPNTDGSELAIAHVNILSKNPVSELEDAVRQAEGDVYKLRDTLLQACQGLIKPRRRLGLHTGAVMSPDALELLKQERQKRLRLIVHDCLRGIYQSGVGGDLLRVAMDHVQELINKFEEKDDDVRLGISGKSWHTLKALVVEINDKLPEDETPGTKVQRFTEKEGKNTKCLIDRILTELGGSASTAEMFAWIDKHPEVLNEEKDFKLNLKKSMASNRARDSLVWHSTFRSILCKKFSKSSRPRRSDGVYVWRFKDSEEPEEPEDDDPSEGKPIKCRKPGSRAAKQAPTSVKSPDLPCTPDGAVKTETEGNTVSVPEMDGHSEIIAN